MQLHPDLRLLSFQLRCTRGLTWYRVKPQRRCVGVQEATHDSTTQELCGDEYCYGCMRSFEQQADAVSGTGDEASMASFASRCPQCRRLFCYDCDSFVHETLHNCPGCENGELREPGPVGSGDAMMTD